MDISTEVLAIAQAHLKKVQRSGPDNVMAVCPFHRKADGSEERNPSFAISLSKGVFFCHNCHETGGLKKLLLALGYSHSHINAQFGAVFELIGVRPPSDPNGSIRPTSIFSSKPIEESLLGVFDYDVSPLLPQFSKETLKHFDLGWDGWHNRITFPIRDINGELVAISGRATMDEQRPRYKIYTKEYLAWQQPERADWQKGNVLWNADKVYPKAYFSPGIPGDAYVIVVEGFKAAMWMWECGYRNVVAMLGSYLTHEHAWLLETINYPVYLFLDNNEAGIHGSIGAARRLDTGDHRVHLVEYPSRLREDDSAQPDDLTAEEVREQLALAPKYTEWRRRRRDWRENVLR